MRAALIQFGDPHYAMAFRKTIAPIESFYRLGVLAADQRQDILLAHPGILQGLKRGANQLEETNVD